MSGRQARRQRAHSVNVPPGKLVQAQVLTPTGEKALVDNLRQMPRKRSGVHRWQAMVVHALSEEQAEALDRGDRVLFDGSSVVMMPVAYCIDCEARFADVAGLPCPAGDEWRDRPRA